MSTTSLGSASGHRRLAGEFGSDLPPGLAQLPEADAARLVDAIQTTRARQAAALEEATENGLAFIPRLLRGTVRKVLFG